MVLKVLVFIKISKSIKSQFLRELSTSITKIKLQIYVCIIDTVTVRKASNDIYS